MIDENGRPKYPGVVDTWFTMLDRGHRATGMGVSDSHGVFNDDREAMSMSRREERQLRGCRR